MTDNPLFDTILASGDITKRANPQVMDWTTTKSKVLTELEKRQAQSGYSCDMIIIDDVIVVGRPPEERERIYKLCQEYMDNRILNAFRIPETAIKASTRGSVLFNEAELTAQIFDEKLAKTWGRKYD
jgi:hypothetical protein